MKYLVANFAYGTGPYLRTAELARAVNREYRLRGREPFDVIVPWVYGEKQKRIMRDAFGNGGNADGGAILLDRVLGEIVGGVFYGNNTYEEALRLWVERHDALSHAAGAHLSGVITLEDLDGTVRTVSHPDIAAELNRAGRIAYGVAPVYAVTFGYISAILEETLTAPAGAIAVDRDLVRRAIPMALEIERWQALHARAHPGTFSYRADEGRAWPDDIAIPPTIDPPSPHDEPMDEGIYVTITGIPGLERLYGEAHALGLRLYTNDPEAVPDAHVLPPRAVANPRIKLQFARSGWGSVWLSQLVGTPLVVPAYDPHDDPEIYFNNICIEKLGLGIVYRGQPLGEILAEAERLRPGIAAYNRSLAERFGTLDGNAYAARLVADRVSGGTR